MKELYPFVYRGLLTQESLDKAGRKASYKFGSEDSRLIDEKLSLEMLDPEAIASAQRMALVYTAVHAFENTVRDFVRSAMIEVHKEDWWSTVPAKIQAKAKIRMEEEARFRWHGARGGAEIDYCDFGDLSSIIVTQWETFKDVLVDLEWTKSLLAVLERSRNIDGADREPPYYPASHEFNASIRSDVRSRSRQLILFSLAAFPCHMKPRHLLIGCIAFAAIAHVCAAKPHKHPPPQQHKPAPAQAPAPPPPPPASALPSVQLQYFFDMHLNNIFAPIDAKIPPLPRDQLTQLNESFKDGLAGAPPEKKPMYEAAIGVCDLLARAMDEREKHASNLQGAFAHSLDPAPADRTVNRRADAVNEVLITTKREWTYRAVSLRKLINIRYAQERQKERDAAAVAKPST